MTRKVTLKIAEYSLFVILGIVLGLMFRGIPFWSMILVGFGIGSIVSAVSEHYAGLVKDLINWIRRPARS